jgi:serine/threonine-protein kinase HipA
VNGKRDGFTLSDFEACAAAAALGRGRSRTIVAEVREAVAQWPRFADAAGVGAEWRRAIDPSLRLDLPA